MNDAFFRETDFVNTQRGIFAKAWKILRFDDVISLQYGKGLPDGKRNQGKYPVVGSNGVIGYHNKALVKGPGIVVGRKGTIGAVTWFDSDFWPIDTTYYVKVKTGEIDLKWLFFELVHLNLPRLSLADVVPGLKREIVNSLVVPLPPLAEQRKIADILGVVDSAIELVDRVIWKTERLKKGLMQTLLTRGIGHKEYKQTPIGTTPKTWQIEEISNLGELQYGYTTSATNENTGTKFLRVTDIKDDGRINWNEIPYCHIDEKDYEKYALEEGDILFARIGATAGKTGFIDRKIKGIFASYLIRLKIAKDNVFPKFVFYFTQSPAYWLRALREREGQLKKGINATMLSKFQVPLPPFPEQKQIAEIISAVNKKLELERNEKSRLERIKQGLMDLLLTGKIRVKVD